jgi:5-formyltetrahydrofolate cyclo-ligase
MTQGELRDQIWKTLMKERAVSYPLPPYGHHPNFKGSSKAAEVLLEYLFANNDLTAGQAVVCYPDYVLKSLRKGLLERGVNVIVPAQHGDSYKFLDSASVNPAKVSSIAGAEKVGQTLTVLPPVAIAFLACVAVSKQGDVLHKGFGFRLPELPLTTRSVTIAHPLQVVPEISESEARVMCYATPEQLFIS